MTYTPSAAAFADTRPHYQLLDGLRGAAALMVVWYHVHEGFAFASGAPVIAHFNHGHLAVDFFFMLSGFVLSYAYDARWQSTAPHKLTLRSFALRRLVRLHPMILLSALIGLAAFLWGGGVAWDGTAAQPLMMVVATLMAALLLPMPNGAPCDVRGNGEMFPLNGPSWSLFFEYVGNILYVLFIRRLSTRCLTLLVGALGLCWGAFCLADVSGYGMLGVGWSMTDVNFLGGLLRMLFPFTLGMLLARRFRPTRVRGIFWIAIAALLLAFGIPYLPGTWMGMNLNSAYEFLLVCLLFPAIVWLGAGGAVGQGLGGKVCRLLGDLSYPLYLVHYPLMYLFYAWLIQQQLFTLAHTWPVVLAVVGASLLLAWLSLQLYDLPLRRWMAKRI